MMLFLAMAMFRINIDLVPSLPSTVKLGYCQKATKFEKKNLPKKQVRNFNFFLAFSENLNFTAKNGERK